MRRAAHVAIIALTVLAYLGLGFVVGLAAADDPKPRPPASRVVQRDTVISLGWREHAAKLNSEGHDCRVWVQRTRGGELEAILGCTR